MRKGDLAGFHRAVRWIHATRHPDHFNGHLLAALREIIAADIALADWKNCRLHDVKTTYDPAGAISPEINQAVHRHLHDNPLYGRRLREASSISDHLSRLKWERSALFNEGYGKAGQQDGLAIDLRFADGCLLSLCTTRARRGFSPAERFSLTLLKDHVADVYRFLTRSRGLGSWLRTTGTGEILDADESSLTLLSRFFRTPATRRLPAELRQWLHAADHGSASFRSGPRELLIHRSLAEGGVIALHLEERLPEEIALTNREKQVLEWLAEGRTNAEIALLLGIRPGTVKRHLENIYAKTGTGNRHQAAKLHFPSSS